MTNRIWTPDDEEQVPRRLEAASRKLDCVSPKAVVVACLIKPNGNKKWYEGSNRIMTVGHNYYAAKIAGTVPSPSFADPAMELGTGATAGFDSSDIMTRADLTPKVPLSLKRIDASSGYPKVSDPDPDNAIPILPRILTWRVTYDTSEAIGTNISHVILLDYAGGSPGASDPVISLAALLIPVPSKTASDALKIFINHEFRSP